MKICVYAICKDELKFIDKGLENMSEADYIVVLDTGSTDGTYEFLKTDKRVTRVEQKVIKPWRFDVARNESMKLIPEDADVCICTDPDELFNVGGANAIKNKWVLGQTMRGEYSYAGNHDSNGAPAIVYKYHKLHANDPRYHGIYPCHERIELFEDVGDFKTKEELEMEPYLAFTEDELFLHHYQDLNKSRSSYLPLLKLATEERPNNLHLKMLYARELVIQHQLEPAIKEYLKIIDHKDVDLPCGHFTLLDTLQMLANTYYTLGNYDMAILYANEFIKVDGTYRDLYLFLADIYISQGIYTVAEGLIESAKKYCYRHYDWVEHSGAGDGWLENLEAKIAEGKSTLITVNEAV